MTARDSRRDQQSATYRGGFLVKRQMGEVGGLDPKNLPAHITRNSAAALRGGVQRGVESLTAELGKKRSLSKLNRESRRADSNR